MIFYSCALEQSFYEKIALIELNDNKNMYIKY
jgi:hypothetical protein